MSTFASTLQGGGLLERYFAFAARGTTFARDTMAGATTFVVPGQYQRDQRRTRLTALPHGRLQMVVAATRQIAKGAAGGQLTLAIYRASCHGRRVVLGRVLQRRSRVDRRGVARFSFATPGYGFYLGRVTFGGNSLILRGRDPDDMTLVKRTSPGTFGFIDPAVWVPC